MNQDSSQACALPVVNIGRDAALRQYLIPLASFLLEPTVMEVCINRPGEVLVEVARGGASAWERHEMPELNLDFCRRVARLVATYCGKDVGREDPILSATLPDGERIEVALPPATPFDRVVLTIRKPGRTELGLLELEARSAFDEVTFLKSVKTMPQDMLLPADRDILAVAATGNARGFLEACVLGRKNIMIAGKTQSGKTTLMKALLRAIPPGERLITLEDVHELALSDRQNAIHLFFARDGESGPTASELLRACVRHRPDRILPGELRGAEAWVYLNALNTGHPGSISTVHANGARETFRRIAELIKDSAVGDRLEMRYLMESLHATIDVVVFCHERKVKEIYFDPYRKLAALT